METPSEQRGGLEYYRIALVQPRLQAVLAESHDGALRLPSVGIRPRMRRAEQLSTAVRQRWSINSVLIDILPPVPEMYQCAVVEVLPCDQQSWMDDLVPSSPNERSIGNLSICECDTLHNLLRGETTGMGLFSRVGSILEVLEWIRTTVSNRHIEFNNDIRMTNVGGAFALVRFGTSQPPALWLKATGVPNKHEFAVTVKLALLFPNYLPPLVATRPDWNAWLMEEAGEPLDTSMSSLALEQATHCLAKLQLDSVDHVDELLACGCFDQRIPILRASLPLMCRYLEDAMQGQTSTRVSPISAQHLEKLCGLLNEACNAVERIGIPDALIHNDMNAGNILFDGSRVVFTDWAEAYIGNPFITFHHLHVQAQRSDPTSALASKVRAIYANHWRGRLGDVQLSRSLALSPPLAIASYLVGRDTTFQSPHRTDLQGQSYARSLARHLDRAAQAPEFLEALCH